MTNASAINDKTARARSERGTDRLREEYLETLAELPFIATNGGASRSIESLGFPAAADLLIEMGAPLEPRARCSSGNAGLQSKTKPAHILGTFNQPAERQPMRPMDSFAAMVEMMARSETSLSNKTSEPAAA